MELGGQVALITGSSRGIGRAMAIECGAAGARVVLVARDDGGLNETARLVRERGGDTWVLPADLTDGHQVEEIVNQVDQGWGRIDLLVNNAGRLSAIGPSWLVDPNDWWADVATNIGSMYLCSWATIPRMIARKQGRIINVVGGGSRGPFPFASAYGCSKAAILRFTQSLAEELTDTGVFTFALNPGLVRTEMTRQFLETEPGRQWMLRLRERLERGEDVPPQRAARLVAALATGRYDEAHGQLLDATVESERLADIASQVAI